jgi:hypothetical protein
MIHRNICRRRVLIEKYDIDEECFDVIKKYFYKRISLVKKTGKLNTKAVSSIEMFIYSYIEKVHVFIREPEGGDFYNFIFEEFLKGLKHYRDTKDEVACFNYFGVVIRVAVSKYYNH